ncbi:hypothetical protein [Siansivirga zeaxanthinifaciens]|uniref:Uncharacterized protein n=1 Tax=Siansivirga zeaxanthinifaciens CC-SAMT-1 TaxID=1454006 RepID=A0A0C5W5Q5_9FLAO|nr:hypothetical protein [Siansivirga zeaxanthinifaciens]AJR02478.1 hypothetical protein AW14_01275 [Siansivirga zeaxanthinifaciens CC-SAMT-1]
MKARILSVLIAVLVASSVFSQNSLDKYKYVIVPNKFDFFKERNQYRLNEFTKFLFNKYGFIAVMEGSEYPKDLANNRCIALKSDVLKDSGLFKTKLAVELKDCNDVVVFTGAYGSSREKEYDKAYTEALRNAFQSVEALNHKYDANAATQPETTNDSETNTEVVTEIAKLKEELKTLKEEKQTEVVETAKPKVVEVVKVTKAKTEETTKALPIPSGILYAQAIENGFQLVDSTPKVVYKIRKTGIDGVYMVENNNATIYKKGADWIIEYYENNVLKQDVLNIKF